MLLNLSKIPFTYMWYLRRFCGSPKTVLDLGCGDGELMRTIGEKRWKIIGVDIYDKSLKDAEKTGMYKRLVKGDLVTVCKKLIKQKRVFDLVFCSQAIEHITKKEGEEILKLVEKLAKGRIYFGTPRGFMIQPEVFLGDNPYQHHQSGWSLEDFKTRDYKVYGVGFMPIWSERGLARSSNKLVSLIAGAISYIMSPIVYFLPSLGAGMMAVKDK